MTKPTLLALPAALRTAIYEFASLESDPIYVTRQIRPPGLHSACRWIRKESQQIWYRQNTFRFNVQDCDASLLAAFQTLHHTFGIRQVKAVVQVYGVPHGPNLIRWCKLLFESSGKGIRIRDELDRDETVVAAAHETVARHVKYGTSWVECEKALKMLLTVVGKFEPAWSWS